MWRALAKSHNRDIGLCLYYLFRSILYATYAFGSSFPPPPTPCCALAVISWDCATGKRWYMEYTVTMDSFIITQLVMDISGFTLGQQHGRSYLNHRRSLHNEKYN